MAISNSFRTRITLLVSGLVVLSLLATFTLVNSQNNEVARSAVNSSITTTEQTFRSLLETRTLSLFDVVRPATRDHAFRTTYIDGHVPTLESAMRNLLSRIRNVPADLMIITDLDLALTATQLPVDIDVAQLPLQELVDQAISNPDFESSLIVTSQNTPYQLIATPMLLPNPVGWIFVGFPVSQQFVDTSKDISQTDASVLAHTPRGWQLTSTTLTQNARADFIAELPNLMNEGADFSAIEAVLDGNPYLSKLTLLGATSYGEAYVALHGDLDRALAPYRAINHSMYFIFGSALVLSLAAAFYLSSSLSAPLQKLTAGVRKIQAGELGHRVQQHSGDEMGQLATAFNELAAGMEEKEKVRNLLGKVVSEEIAHELLSNRIELGGEERNLCVLFCDVRNFTALCEASTPQQTLAKLNQFFTIAANIIEQHGGVVDKYMGDAVMALFGAPVANGNEEQNAVQTALALEDAMADSNIGFDVGIGIASGVAVAGNMGSTDRLNYSVIGDSVNVASRLEGLTRFYGVSTLVNGPICEAAKETSYRWVDRVQVKGKQQAIDIFQPLAKVEDMQQHEMARGHYFAGNWRAAFDIWQSLAQAHPQQRLYQIFCERLEENSFEAPSGWQGVFTHTSKGNS